MIEPTLALQTAIRTALITAPAVTDHVDPVHVRSGSTRPDHFPCIIMGSSTTTLHGHDYRAQRAAWVFLDIHVFAKGDDVAKEIAFAAQSALDKTLKVEGGFLDHFRITRAVYPRDPDPSIGHGVLSAEALVRWMV